MARRPRIVAAAGITGALLVLAAPAESSWRATRVSSTRDWAHTLGVQRNGKIVAAGLSRQRSGPSFAVARYAEKGTVDNSFGRSGRVLTRIGMYGASAVAIGPNGTLVVAGSGGLVRYRANGRLDPSFGHGGIRGGFDASDVAIQKDGKIVASGASGKHSALARFNARGNLDASFGQGGTFATSFGAAALAIQADGKIVTVGTALISGGFYFALSRYRAEGGLDPTFGTGGKVLTSFGFGSLARALAIQPDGKIVAAGEAGFSDFALARYNDDGKVDASFGSGGKVLTDFTPATNCSGCEKSKDSIHALAIQADGKIVAVGSSDAHGNCDDRGHSCDNFALARYDVDGSLDPSFGSGGKVVTGFVRRPPHEPSSSLGEAVAIQKNGKLLVAGLVAGYDFALARYTTGGRLDRSFGSGGKVLTDFGGSG
jgi:uncharacterized delta-60 repeat protein